jgi:hypothetical protein
VIDADTRGPYVVSRSGRKLYVMSPSPDDFIVDDIAYALAHINRYSGNAGLCSVGQHCLHVEDIVRRRGGDRETRLAALFHDAAEMVIGDIPSPAKRQMGCALEIIEDGILHAVYLKVGIKDPSYYITGPGLKDIKKADLCALATEVRDFRVTHWGRVPEGTESAVWNHVTPDPDTKLAPIYPPKVVEAFQEKAKELMS